MPSATLRVSTDTEPLRALGQPAKSANPHSLVKSEIPAMVLPSKTETADTPEPWSDTLYPSGLTPDCAVPASRSPPLIVPVGATVSSSVVSTPLTSSTFVSTGAHGVPLPSPQLMDTMYDDVSAGRLRFSYGAV